MLQDYWWAIFIGLALLAVLVLWLVLGRRKGVGTEAAASLRDLDGSQSARPTFARPDPMSTPPPLATGSSVGVEAAAAPIVRDEGGGNEAFEAGRVAPVTEPEPARPAPASTSAEPPIAVFVGDDPTEAAGDDLTRMKGLGPKLRDRLAELGVTCFAQIAAWDEAEIDRIDAQLDRFAGRIRRDDWVEQARFLATDDRAGYEARFGALGGA